MHFDQIIQKSTKTTMCILQVRPFFNNQTSKNACLTRSGDLTYGFLTLMQAGRSFCQFLGKKGVLFHLTNVTSYNLTKIKTQLQRKQNAFFDSFYLLLEPQTPLDVQVFIFSKENLKIKGRIIIYLLFFVSSNPC